MRVRCEADRVAESPVRVRPDWFHGSYEEGSEIVRRSEITRMHDATQRHPPEIPRLEIAFSQQREHQRSVRHALSE